MSGKLISLDFFVPEYKSNFVKIGNVSYSVEVAKLNECNLCVTSVVVCGIGSSCGLEVDVDNYW